MSWLGGFWIIKVSVDKMVGMVVVAVVGYCTLLNMVVVVTIFCKGGYVSVVEVLYLSIVCVRAVVVLKLKLK